MRKEKELLRKQLEILAKQSKDLPDKELSLLSSSMNDIYKTLTMNELLLAFCFMVLPYFVIGVLVHIKKLFWSKSR